MAAICLYPSLPLVLQVNGIKYYCFKKLVTSETQAFDVFIYL